MTRYSSQSSRSIAGSSLVATACPALVNLDLLENLLVQLLHCSLSQVKLLSELADDDGGIFSLVHAHFFHFLAIELNFENANGHSGLLGHRLLMACLRRLLILPRMR